MSRVSKGVWSIVFVGIMISLIIAGVVSYYADSNPDGLERVAEDQGFIEDAADSANAEIFASDYGIAGVEDERLSVGIAGVLGIVVMVVVGFGLFWFLGRGKKPTPIA
jgi:cobalt/nickel transport protein